MSKKSKGKTSVTIKHDPILQELQAIRLLLIQIANNTSKNGVYIAPAPFITTTCGMSDGAPIRQKSAD